MRSIVKSTLILFISLSIVLLSSCGDSISGMKKAIENRDADKTIELINSTLEKNNNVDKMNEMLSEMFGELLGKTEYENFVFVEKVRDGINDSETKEQIEKMLNENASNKVLSFLTGTWIRKDGTDLDGCYGDITWNGETGVLILSNVSETINPEKFNEKDLKWNNVSVIDATTIKGDDLSKSEGVGDYRAFTGEIDYENNMIHTQTVDDSTDYAKGSNQTWILKSYYDSFEGKQVLTEEDFNVTTDEDGARNMVDEFNSGHQYYFYYYDPEVDKSEEGVVTTKRGIHLGSTKEDVIDQYGIGSYARYDKDADIIRFSEGGVPPQVEKAKYSLQYRVNDKKGKRIFFYFDENDKVIAVLFAVSDYSSMLKEIQ